MKQWNKYMRCAIIFALILSFAVPGQAFAAMPDTDIVHPQESAYLAGYSAYVHPAGHGKIQVWFDVTGTHIMDDIGALSIEIYESADNSNWRWVESFTNKETYSMLGHNSRAYGSHVDYQAVVGCYYKAKVCVWAGRNGGGDRRYFWTATVRAY